MSSADSGRTTATGNGGTRHLAYVDGLRALAALWVVLAHVYSTLWPEYLREPPSGVVAISTAWMVFGNGHYAVAAFIVVSGFCLALPVMRSGGRLHGGAARFFARRARRILPPYYLAFALSLVVVWIAIPRGTGSFWDIIVPVDRDGILGHLFLVQDVVGRDQANPPLWSIAVEWRIYFLLPLLVLAFRYLRAVTVVVAAVFLAYTGFLAAASLGAIGSNVQFAALFVLGMLAAKIALAEHGAWPAVRRRAPWSLLALTFGLTVLVVHELVGPYSLGARYFLDLPLGLALTALLVAGSRPGRTAAVLGFRPLAFIGAFSYSIYLIHVPLLAVTWQYALDPLGLHGARALAPMLVVGLPLIVGLSYLFFVCCERPFMSGSQRRAARGDFAQPDVDRREEHHRPSLDPPVSVGNVPA